MPWMCGQLQVLRLDFKIGELVRHLAVNVTMPMVGIREHSRVVVGRRSDFPQQWLK